VAVAFDNRRLTYGELNQKANQLANHLLKVGTGRAAVVGIYMDRSEDMMVALLGAGASGVGLANEVKLTAVATIPLSATDLAIILTPFILGLLRWSWGQR